MAEPIKLQGEPRTRFGKGVARRLRKAGKVPASIYAGGKQPVFLQLTQHDLNNALRHTNAVYDLSFGKEEHLAVVKDVQRNPIKPVIEHVDFYEVKPGEKIDIVVPIFVHGETKGIGVAFVDIQQLHVRADVSNLPDRFDLSVEGMQAGDEISAGDIKLPKGAQLLDIDPKTTVVSVTIPQEEVPSSQPEAASEVATAEGAGAAPAATAAAAAPSSSDSGASSASSSK